MKLDSMNKIIVIGCPGSGKSTLSMKLAQTLKYAVLHLDEIYHIDNDNNIGRPELIKKTIEFAEGNDKWIIDGNYKGTLDLRMDLCDTIILFNIDTETCLENVYNRSKHGRVAMAENFDGSKIDDSFIGFVKEFQQKFYPEIYKKAVDSQKELIILNDYDKMNEFIETLSLKT